MERFIEKGLFSSRWLMAPMYLGLVVALGMLVVVFVQELIHYVPLTLSMDADKGILAILSLIDLTLAANLMLIVLFSGYENFVSKLDIDDNEDKPEWMGKVDFSGLKMKLIASIVAISGIHLLKVFMELGKAPEGHVIDQAQLMWMVILHLTFVVSGVLLALMDWMAGKTDKH
uniref:TIGR00645 family protein n=1 Tax=Rhodobacter ferrooxidans TaxID=371731 RepID=UPI0018DCB447